MDNTVNNMFGSIVYSAFKYKDKYVDCDIFFKLISDIYQPLELSHIILIRSIIIEETSQEFFEHNSNKVIDVRQLYLSKDQVDHIIGIIFGMGNTIKINRFKTKLLETYPNFRTELRLKTYLFIDFSIKDYYRCRTMGGGDGLKGVEEIAGITPTRLNQEQDRQGLNKRLRRGMDVMGNTAGKLKQIQRVEMGASEQNTDRNTARSRSTSIKKKDAGRSLPPKHSADKRSVANKDKEGVKQDEKSPAATRPRSTNRVLIDKMTKTNKEKNVDEDRKYRKLVREVMEDVIHSVAEMFVDMPEDSSKFCLNI